MKAIISLTVKLKHWYFQCRNRKLGVGSVIIGHVCLKLGLMIHCMVS